MAGCGERGRFTPFSAWWKSPRARLAFHISHNMGRHNMSQFSPDVCICPSFLLLLQDLNVLHPAMPHTKGAKAVSDGLSTLQRQCVQRQARALFLVQTRLRVNLALGNHVAYSFTYLTLKRDSCCTRMFTTLKGGGAVLRGY